MRMLYMPELTNAYADARHSVLKSANDYMRNPTTDQPFNPSHLRTRAENTEILRRLNEDRDARHVNYLRSTDMY
jgi:hypothetical protein